MKGPGLRAKRALLSLCGLAVTGRRLGRSEVPEVDRDLALSGFRKAARSFLLRRTAAFALRDGGMTILCRCLDGRFTLACAGDDFGVGWEILEKGTYEPHLVDFYRRTVRPGMTILDVGANIGFHAFHAASLVGPEGRVFAVEPDPRNASLLRLSLSQNSGAPVEVIEGALSDGDADLVLTDLGNEGNSGARFTHADRAVLLPLVHGPNPRFRTVQAFRWDTRHLATPMHLVKLDVEGFEPRIVRGMEQSLARHRPIVVSEYAPSNLERLGGASGTAYRGWFEERGYTCEILDEGTARLIPATPDGLERALAGRHHLDVVFSPVAG